VLLQCTADLLTCALRRNLFDVLDVQFGITPPTPPLSDEASITFLRKIIFHWDAIPKTAQFVYRIHTIWCGKGWVDSVEVLPEDLFNIEAVADSDDDFEQVEDSVDYGDTDVEEGEEVLFESL
jgi:hypothetical protein